MDYIEFLKSKMAISNQSGFDIEESEITESLYPHVKDTDRNFKSVNRGAANKVRGKNNRPSQSDCKYRGVHWDLLTKIIINHKK